VPMPFNISSRRRRLSSRSARMAATPCHSSKERLGRGGVWVPFICVLRLEKKPRRHTLGGSALTHQCRSVIQRLFKEPANRVGAASRLPFLKQANTRSP
jgi:hypothetical protein